MKKLLTTAVCLALFCAFPVLGDQWNKMTKMTFNEAVELPGVVLPPGTYVFKLMDSLSTRHIVQIFNEDQTHIYATILAIPDYRLEPKDKTVVRFEERAPNNPQAVRAWFYPGDNFGQEFVYPKARATELAATAHVPVPAAEVQPTETPEELLKTPVIAVTPEHKEVEVAEAIETVPVQAEPTPPVSVASAPAAPPIEELPKTASFAPLLALAGCISLLLAAMLKLIARSIS